jgi:hypothetical protein
MKNIFELYEDCDGWKLATKGGIKLATELALRLQKRHGGPLSKEEAKRRYEDELLDCEESTDTDIKWFAEKVNKWSRVWDNVGACDSESRYALRRYALKLLTENLDGQ